MLPGYIHFSLLFAFLLRTFPISIFHFSHPQYSQNVHLNIFKHTHPIELILWKRNSPGVCDFPHAIHFPNFHFGETVTVKSEYLWQYFGLFNERMRALFEFVISDSRTPLQLPIRRKLFVFRDEILYGQLFSGCKVLSQRERQIWSVRCCQGVERALRSPCFVYDGLPSTALTVVRVCVAASGMINEMKKMHAENSYFS